MRKEWDPVNWESCLRYWISCESDLTAEWTVDEYMNHQVLVFKRSVGSLQVSLSNTEKSKYYHERDDVTTHWNWDQNEIN